MIELLGKLHPLLVHLPIGFLLLLGGLEWLARRPKWKDLNVANRLIALASMIVAAGSVASGWLLASNDDYNPGTLFWHRWLGTGVAVATALLWILRQRGWMTAYRRGLALTIGLLVVASHFGGTLTHGTGFLAWPKTGQTGVLPATQEDLLNLPVYASFVQPIFDDYCVGCHGEQKSKGGLRLDSAEHLVQGGDSGSAIDPAGAKASLLGQRISLPLEHDDHMPPESKPQLSDAESTLLLWWLDQGAPTISVELQSLKPPATILLAIQQATGQADIDGTVD